MLLLFDLSSSLYTKLDELTLEFVPAQNQANSEQTNLIEPQSKISSKYPSSVRLRVE
jgi:hypothetical protein